jgi:hypothetical protein
MIRLIVAIAALSLVCITGYAGWWFVWYRIPRPDGVKLIDLRAPSDKSASRYITFCASLASNKHGFPGHAYVVWSGESLPSDWLVAARSDRLENAGYGPRNCGDQVKSVVYDVPGIIDAHGLRCNLRNLSTLTVIVNQAQYERTRQLRAKWDTSRFKAGDRDCVAFVDYIAKDIGLSIPPRNILLFPQDHLAQMKALNWHLQCAPAGDGAIVCSTKQNNLSAGISDAKAK